MFEIFMTDLVTLLKSDGTRYENVKAGVQPEMIFITDSLLPIECGDKIMRHLPSGIDEIFVITDPRFQQAISSIPAHYQAQYKREGTVKPTEALGNVTFNVTGPHSHVNINSIDESINISNVAVASTFDEIRAVLKDQVTDIEECSRLISKVDELQQVHGTENFSDIYKEFISMAANHMSLIAPLVPALTALL